MANEQNLKPIQTEKEARELGKKGGIASGQARREKATMKKTLEMLLESTNKNGKTYKELATLGLIQGAVKGNSQNYRTIVELLGELNIEGTNEAPILKIEVSDNSNLEKQLYEANKPK